MEDLKFSVIIPVYNTSKTLAKCLSSVILQPYENLEIICINDGSTDDSFEVLKKLQLEDNRIIIINQENGGLSYSRNVGVQHATGDFVIFVDSDDYITEDYTQVIKKIIEEKKADIVVFDFYEVNERGEDISSKYKGQNIEPGSYGSIQVLEHLFSFKIANYSWNKVFRRDVLKDIAFPVGKRYEDVAVMYKIFSNVENIEVIANKLYCYFTTREGSITNSLTSSDVVDISDHVGEMETYFANKKNVKYLNEYIYSLCLANYINILKINDKSPELMGILGVEKERLKKYKKTIKLQNILDNPFKYKICLYNLGLLDIIFQGRSLVK